MVSSVTRSLIGWGAAKSPSIMVIRWRRNGYERGIGASYPPDHRPVQLKLMTGRLSQAFQRGGRARAEGRLGRWLAVEEALAAVDAGGRGGGLGRFGADHLGDGPHLQFAAEVDQMPDQGGVSTVLSQFLDVAPIDLDHIDV